MMDVTVTVGSEPGIRAWYQSLVSFLGSKMPSLTPAVGHIVAAQCLKEGSISVLWPFRKDAASAPFGQPAVAEAPKDGRHSG